ncbi:SseB family protein [Mycetocola reblochoni]|uniref:SseB family protein n=1 Tax=Mycetocola reblochoni TaxID=331618 RepID=UPI003F98A9A7
MTERPDLIDEHFERAIAVVDEFVTDIGVFAATSAVKYLSTARRERAAGIPRQARALDVARVIAEAGGALHLPEAVDAALVDLERAQQNTPSGRTLDRGFVRQLVEREDSQRGALLARHATDFVLVPSHRSRADELSVVELSDAKGNRYVPAFTGHDQFELWQESRQGHSDEEIITTAVLLGQLGELLAASSAVAVVVNPMAENCLLSRPTLGVPAAPQSIPAQTRVAFGVPASVPEGLSALVRSLITASGVDDAAIAQIVQGEGAPEIVVVVSHDGAGQGLERFVEGLHAQLPAGQAVGVLDGRTALGARILASVPGER